jgi:hypothetical protein
MCPGVTSRIATLKFKQWLLKTNSDLIIKIGTEICWIPLKSDIVGSRSFPASSDKIVAVASFNLKRASWADGQLIFNPDGNNEKDAAEIPTGSLAQSPGASR